jgi:hypothetical protein
MFSCAVERDITVERRQPEEERARSLARDLAAALAESEGFLAQACHDVHQPLTIILAVQIDSRVHVRGGHTGARHDTRPA